jgi:RNA polymerase sigma-70 factor (ECF subfamily)
MVSLVSQDDERELLARIAAEDEHAAKVFQQSHVGSLVAFARRSGLAPEDAEDAVQEIFMTAISQIQAGRFRGDSAIGTWLQGILKHKILDYWRMYFRHEGRTVGIESMACSSRSSANPVATGGADEMDRVIEVREVLASLPNDQRSILLLNETEDFSILEIASLMKMKSGTVGRKLAEGKATFRRRILEGVIKRTRRELPLPGGAKKFPSDSDK